ncbi:hypothetical protein Tsp_11092 [Trichinella spiralis]|uniref:hypothetical protein n=1 Tax=Trichinella spiralis TaxID=6334 RepID=UPI0001EFBB9D|nr:hypothetical protein Tsp_11092 [Trichinella spiralis]
MPKQINANYAELNEALLQIRITTRDNIFYLILKYNLRFNKQYQSCAKTALLQ